MAKQETLIYIEKENTTEAEFMSRNFVNPEVKNRAYINTLGAELVIKYLASEGIDMSGIHNMRSISKILENFDIADIILPNIHIDVRTVFDKNQIFIPKSHFENDLTPDIYIAVQLDKDFTNIQILGYFSPAQIDKRKENSEYYFIDIDKISPAEKLVEYIKNFDGTSDIDLSESQILKGRELSVSLADHNISQSEQQELLQLLKQSNSLRESVLEFDNFEVLSYSAAPELHIETTIPMDLGDDMLEENNLNETETTSEQEESPVEPATEQVANENINPIGEVQEEITENLNPELPIEPINIDLPDKELSVDSILDETIAAIDTTTESTQEPNPISEGLAQTLNNAIENVIEKTITTAATTAAAGTAATALEAGEAVAAGFAVSEEAIKLAAVSGEVVENVITDNLEKQQKNLNKIDYQKTDITPDAVEIPENIAELESLSTAKTEANIEAENSGQYDSPTDLSALNTIETYQEEAFEHETIDLNSMDSVKIEDINTDNTEDIVDLANITEIDSPTKPAENIEELTISDMENFEGIELPGISGYTINEDGTSSMDDINVDFALNTEESEENLLDFKMNEISLENITEEPEITDFSEPTPKTEDGNLQDKQKSSDLDFPTEVTDSTESEDDVMEFNEDFFSNEFEIVEEPETPIKSDELDSEPILDEAFEQENKDPSAQLEEIFDEDDETNELQTGDFEAFENFEDFESLSQKEPQEFNNEEIEQFEEFEPQTIENDIPAELNSTEIPAPEAEIEAEFIEKSPITENSTIISDKTFTPGEIQIDINNPIEMEFEGNESLEKIYDENSKLPGGAMLSNPGILGSVRAPQGKGLKLLGVLITLAVVGAIGFGVSKLFKTPTEEVPQPITDDVIPTSPDNGVSEVNTLDVNPDNVVNMDNNTNSLATTTPAAAKQTTTQAVTQTTTAATKTPNKIPATSFIEVKKLTWEVPDYISYNQQFKQYFQSAGKSLKLSLTSDLLLATEPLYSNQVRVSVNFDKNGTFQDSQIIISSGSTQIDKIVLQTVNQTLKVLKAPHSVNNDENTTAILKIYF